VDTDMGCLSVLADADQQPDLSLRSTVLKREFVHRIDQKLNSLKRTQLAIIRGA
jgi:hypothetical protein